MKRDQIFTYLIPIWLNISMLFFIAVFTYITIEEPEAFWGLLCILLVFYYVSKTELGLINMIKKISKERKSLAAYREYSKGKINRRYCLKRHKEIKLDKILHHLNNKPKFRSPGIYVVEMDESRIIHVPPAAVWNAQHMNNV